MIKKIAFILGCVVLVPFALHAAVPAGTDVSKINFTVHNLGYNNVQSDGLTNSQRPTWRAFGSGNNQVCIFCHTPHSATKNYPLWNRVQNTGITYNLYTSSSKLSSAAKTATLTPNNESVLCLSCHDGKTAMNVLHTANRDINQVGSTTVPGSVVIQLLGYAETDTAMGDLPSFPGSTYGANLGATRDSTGAIVNAKAGSNLSDDHPIGFSYAAAQGARSGLVPLASVPSSIRFFGPNKDRIECSSCHDPHVYYGSIRNGSGRQLLSTLTGGAVTASPAQIARTPFLVMDNSGSALCLSCHIK